ncbi:MAG: hypothetical protein RR185_03265 [Angelakisella sp.]
MEYKNIEVFEKFLSDNFNAPVYDIKPFLDELELQTSATGSNHYELSGHETKSGNPKQICFEREDVYFIDGKPVEPCDDFDYIESTIIF